MGTAESGDQVKVLYIAGIGRSGSTVFTRVLNCMSEFVSLGEMRLIWERGLLENESCGCGAVFRKCEFWRSVLEELEKDFPGVGVDEIVGRARRLGLHSARPTRIPAFGYNGYEKDLRLHVAMLGSLYRATARISGKKWLIDSSKQPIYARMLRRVPGLDIHVLHLVRDSRGYVYSRRRRKVRTDAGAAGNIEMGIDAPYQSAARWLYVNIQAETLKSVAGNYARLRYEDFVNSPRTELNRVLRFLGMDDDRPRTDHISGNEVELGPDHSVAGNPNRLQRGTVNLKLDDEWQRKMSFGAYAVSTTVTLPLLVRYGYPVSRRWPKMR